MLCSPNVSKVNLAFWSSSSVVLVDICPSKDSIKMDRTVNSKMFYLQSVSVYNCRQRSCIWSVSLPERFVIHVEQGNQEMKPSQTSTQQ